MFNFCWQCFSSHFLDSNSSYVNLQPGLGVGTWVSRVVFLGLWRQPTSRVGSAEWWQLLWKGYARSRDWRKRSPLPRWPDSTALPDPASLLLKYSSSWSKRLLIIPIFANLKWFSLSDVLWWIRVDDRGEKRQRIKSIWKHIPHALFKQYTADLYFASSNRVDELETDSNQIGATAKCATHTGRCDHRQGDLGWLGGVLKAKVSDGKVGKRLKPNSWPYLDCPYNPICPCNCCKH